jgi:hypothetical protein
MLRLAYKDPDKVLSQNFGVRMFYPIKKVTGQSAAFQGKEKALCIQALV